VLWSAIPEKGIDKDWTSYPTLVDWKALNRSLDQFSIHLRIDTAMLGGAVSTHVQAGRVSADLFALFRVSSIRGRVFTADEAARREPVAMIGEDL